MDSYSIEQFLTKEWMTVYFRRVILIPYAWRCSSCLKRIAQYLE